MRCCFAATAEVNVCFVLNEATSVESILDKYPALSRPAVVSMPENFLSDVNIYVWFSYRLSRKWDLLLQMGLIVAKFYIKTHSVTLDKVCSIHSFLHYKNKCSTLTRMYRAKCCDMC